MTRAKTPACSAGRRVDAANLLGFLGGGMRIRLAAILSFLFLAAFPLRAQPLFTGKVRIGTGAFHFADDHAQGLLYGYLLLEAPWDLTETFTLRVAGESGGGSFSRPLPSPWLVYPIRNRWDLEVLAKGGEPAFARLSRASLVWAAGGSEVELGWFDPDWGAARFHRPTDYFFPLDPFTWDPGHPLASQGLRAKRHLFDDLSLEAAGRFLEGGMDDWIVRLEDKSVAYTVVPSFARSEGRDQVGLELSAVLPDLRLWAEGRYGLEARFPGQAILQRFEAVLGASTVRDGATFTIEAFKDGTGTVLGDLSAGRRDGAYFFASVEKGNPAEWDIFFALAKSTCGGPFLAWPRLGWVYSQGWRFELQAQLPVGEGDGPLAWMAGRATIALTKAF